MNTTEQIVHIRTAFHLTLKPFSVCDIYTNDNVGIPKIHLPPRRVLPIVAPNMCTVVGIVAAVDDPLGVILISWSLCGCFTERDVPCKRDHTVRSQIWVTLVYMELE